MPVLPGRQHERARIAAARLINADPADVALIASVSYGVATAAKLLTIPARHACHRAGRRSFLPGAGMAGTRADAQGFAVETVRQPSDADWTSAVLARDRSIRARLRFALASISSVHWSDGGLIDIEQGGRPRCDGKARAS